MATQAVKEITARVRWYITLCADTQRYISVHSTSMWRSHGMGRGRKNWFIMATQAATDYKQGMG